MAESETTEILAGIKEILQSFSSSGASVGEFLNFLPTFSGNEKESLNAFLDKLNDIANHNNWNDNNKIIALKLKLCGDAEQYLKDHPNIRDSGNFELIVTSLKNQFSRKEVVATNLARLTTSYQLPSESCRQFLSRIEGLSLKCIPNPSKPEFENYRQSLLHSLP